MTDTELLQWQERAIADANAMLGALGEIWQQCNDTLRCPNKGTSPLELRNALVAVQSVASEATRWAMRPAEPTTPTGG